MNIPKRNKGVINILLIMRLVALFAFLQCFPLLSNCQSHDIATEIISLIDSVKNIYGSSDLLVNGPVYYQPNRLANGNPYLYSSEFIRSTVFTGGQTLQGINLNYDIASQQLILITSMASGARLSISLSNVLIDSFLINEYMFINPEKINLSTNYSYLQKLNSGIYNMYIGYNKEFINRYNQKNPNGKYSVTQRSLFLQTDSTLININSKRSLVNIFPSIKKDVIAYLRRNKVNLKKATPEQLKQLVEFYNQQLNYTNE